MLAKTPQSSSSFSERVFRLLERVEYKRVETESELEAIVRLRYDAFFKEGAIPFKESGRLEDGYDQGDNVYNLSVHIDGELAGALRLHALAQAGASSPALEAFGEFLLPELNAGKMVLDPNRFVANYSLARLHPELPYVTLRLAYLACEYFNTDLVTMTVRAEHQAFYRRSLFASVACPPRPYPMLSKPISLLFIDFATDRHRILQRHPYWASSEAERELLFGDRSSRQRSRNENAVAA